MIVMTSLQYIIKGAVILTAVWLDVRRRNNKH
jgi:ABC-type xylose transport system permease subunit